MQLNDMTWTEVSAFREYLDPVSYIMFRLKGRGDGSVVTEYN